MADMKFTRDTYLWCMAVVYLFAFGSLYVQIPGLYGDNGLLPARLVLEKAPTSFKDFMEHQPSLLRLMPLIGLDAATGMDLLCLLGIIISALCVIFIAQRNTVSFVILWFLYFSLYQVGQTFLWFQWDILLLEVGFLTILVAPMNFKVWFGGHVAHHHHDQVTMWLVRWLLFRLMFASGVVKLQSHCPTWWGLTALNYHYETQCIPTPLAWFAHHLPEWFQKLSVAAVYLIEIAIPVLFFTPVRRLRIFSALCQIFLMILILLTGNYNFFNLLTCILCLPLLDNKFFGKPHYDKDFFENLPFVGRLWKLLKVLIVLATIALLTYLSVKCFDLRLNNNFTVYSRVAFSQREFQDFVSKCLPVTVWIGNVSLTWEVIKALARILSENTSFFSKSAALVRCLAMSAVAYGMFSISLVPHSAVDQQYRNRLPPLVHRWHANTQLFHLTSSYGLFRRMTGVGGRPEVIVEGSNSLDGKWREYEFFYKPGNVSRVPPIVAPHQPRLDWQMWFAALGSYQHNPWFLNLVYRLLTGQPEVLELIAHNPFPGKPPKYIRAQLYHYYFTKPSGETWPVKWWRRKHVKEYLPILAKDEPSFVNYLKQYNILQVKLKPRSDANWLEQTVRTVREYVGQPEGFKALSMLFTSCLIVKVPLHWIFG